MANIIQISDFDGGRFSIAVNSFQENELQAYIDQYQKEALIDLLGLELYELLILDLDANGVPQSQIYLDIFNDFYKEIYGEYERSQGIKFYLKGIIYFHYVRDLYNRQTTVGVKKVKGENSDSVNVFDIYTRYNNSIETGKVIQAYIYNNDTDYPTFKGQELDFVINI